MASFASSMKSTHLLLARTAAWLLTGLAAFPAAASAADFNITTTGGALVIANGSGNGETLALSQSGTNLVLTAASRTFLVDSTTTTGNATIALAGLTSIAVTGGAGNDTINVGAFTTALPSLTINGGAGDDTINFNGNLTFAANASLDADLQNDTATPGIDGVNVAANAHLVTSGTGTITLKTSRNIALNTGSSLETVNGGITLEANQQTIATASALPGLAVDGALVSSTGTGLVTIRARGGNSGNLAFGVWVFNGGRISGGTTGNLTIIATGGASPVDAIYGLLLNLNSSITSLGAAVNVTGVGGGTTAARSSTGVMMLSSGGTITTASGAITVNGTAGPGADGSVGVSIQGVASKISSVTGNISITGVASAAAMGAHNAGIVVGFGAQVISTGTGPNAATITMVGTGGGGTGTNYGVEVFGALGVVTSVDGAIRLTGTGGAGGVAASSFGVAIGAPGQAANSESVTTTGSAGIEVVADSVRIADTSTSINVRTNTATIRPRTAGTLIALGADDAAGTLGLTAAELGRITAGTLVLGDSQSGAVTVSAAITRTAATNLSLNSGASVTVNAAIDSRGGAVVFTAPSVTGAFARTERIINLSARVPVNATDRTLIAGFVIGGTASKSVLIRAVGPGLAAFGLQGVLANPSIRVMRDGAVVAENDDWGNATSAAAIFNTTARVGGFALANNSADAALLVTLPPGAYTAQVLGGTGSGVVLAEVYDASASPAAESQRLVNISTRGFAGTGEDVLIGGFVVTGSASKRMLVRGIGPGLAQFGLGGTLVDPRLRVYRGTTLVAENDNWSAVPAEATANAEAARVTGGFTLPTGSRDAVLVLTLPPGTYTAQVGGADGTSTGTALVEIYEIPE